MRAHACIIIIICTRTCFTHNAAYIVAIGLHRTTTSYPSRDFSAARNIFCLNLKRTAFGNVKTTLGLVLAALQVVLVPSTNVRRIAHSLIHEPFKERLLLTRLREAQNKKSKVSRGSFRQSRPETTPPSDEEVIRSQALDRALDRARRRPRRRPSTSRAHTHIATAIIVTLAPLNAHATPPRARAIVDIQRSIAHRSQPSSHGPRRIVVRHRRAPSVSPPRLHRHRTFCVFFFIGVVRFWVPPTAATTTRVVDTASIVVHEAESRSDARRDGSSARTHGFFMGCVCGILYVHACP